MEPSVRLDKERRPVVPKSVKVRRVLVPSVMDKVPVLPMAIVGVVWLKVRFPDVSTWNKSPDPTVSRARGELSPMPSLLFASSQKKLVLSWVSIPVGPAKRTEPRVRPVSAKELLVTMVSTVRMPVVPKSVKVSKVLVPSVTEMVVASVIDILGEAWPKEKTLLFTSNPK